MLRLRSALTLSRVEGLINLFYLKMNTKSSPPKFRFIHSVAKIKVELSK